ncbi:MAG TPA: DUF742 domain-containing protein, partial [Streptosporangiaceae bacterium]
MFGRGRDDWEAGGRLYPADRDGFGGPAGGHAPPRDPWLQDPNPNGLGDEASSLVRPYAVTGGRTKPRYQLQIEAMVAASHYEA